MTTMKAAADKTAAANSRASISVQLTARRLMTRRPLARCLSLALFATSSGCMLFTPTSKPLEGVIRESFSVRVNVPPSPEDAAMEPEDAEPIGLSELAAAETYTAQGRGVFPSNSSSPVQRLGLARAQARRAALESLARNILDAESAGGRQLNVVLPPRSPRRDRLEEAIEILAHVDFSEMGDEVIAVATLGGESIQVALLSDTPGAALPATDASISEAAQRLERARGDAVELAMEAARQSVQAKIMKLQTSAGPIKNIVYRDRSAREAIRTMIAELEPESVEYSDDGRCIVTIEFDKARLEELVK